MFFKNKSSYNPLQTTDQPHSLPVDGFAPIGDSYLCTKSESSAEEAVFPTFQTRINSIP